jgi:hypothetical protein
MVYAMFSIGILGFLVWSQLVALPDSNFRVINFTIGWKDYTLLNTFYSSDVNNFVQSAGNSIYFYFLYLILVFFILKIIDDKYIERGSSETIRENSCEKFRKGYLHLYGKPFEPNDQ